MDYNDAQKYAKAIKKGIRSDENKFKLNIVGSLARKEDKIKDIDFLLVTDRFKEDMLETLYFTEASNIVITKKYGCGDRKCSLKILLKKYDKSLKIDIFYSTKIEEPFAMLAWIGPRLYNIRLRNKAKTRGLLLNQYGLYKNDKRIRNIKTQSDIQRYIDVTVRSPTQR